MLLNCGVEKALESPLDCKDMKPLHPKGNQSWIFIERTDAETEAPILCPLDAKNWLTGKDPDAGKDWRQEEKGMTEDEMAGWHHQLDGHVFEQTLGVGDGLEGLACCSPWGRKELGTTEWLNWTEPLTKLCLCFWMKGPIFSWCAVSANYVVPLGNNCVVSLKAHWGNVMNPLLWHKLPKTEAKL